MKIKESSGVCLEIEARSLGVCISAAGRGRRIREEFLNECAFIQSLAQHLS